jgi:uncharacterized protein YxjI
MTIAVNCPCGMSYNLKDQFAGQVLKCRQCRENLHVGHQSNGNQSSGNQSSGNQFSSNQSGDHQTPSSSPQQANSTPRHRDQYSINQYPAFNRDKFLLNQKLLTLSEKYEVCDEQGEPILYIERPRHILRNLAAVFGGIFAGIIMITIATIVGSLLPSEIGALITVLGVFGGIVGGFIAGIFLSKKRDVTIYRDQSKQEPLVKVIQDKKFEWFTATFTVRDMQGDLARFRKNYFYDIFRKRWQCYRPDGSLLCMAKEDSIELALLRRFLGNFYGLLRTNFIILEGNSDYLLGEFNRKFTLFDRYVLDMTADENHLLDRRIALALGVILDTGERR